MTGVEILLLEFYYLNHPKDFLAVISGLRSQNQLVIFSKTLHKSQQLMVLNLGTRNLFTDAPSAKEQPRSKALYSMPPSSILLESVLPAKIS